MKYETPELTVLTPAINAVQTQGSKGVQPHLDNPANDSIGAYADWED